MTLKSHTNIFWERTAVSLVPRLVKTKLNVVNPPILTGQQTHIQALVLLTDKYKWMVSISIAY